MDVSIIIVNYNTKLLILNCLKSIFEQTKNITFEVYVSDNGSCDDSVEAIRKQFPEVKIIENNANLGFGAANNRALDKATGKYVFYLNSDTFFLNNAVKFFFDYWEGAKNNSEIGTLGCRLQNSKGDYIHSGSCFPTPRNQLFLFIKNLISCYIYRFIPHKAKKRKEEYTIGQIDYVTGADMFMKNDFDARFDERYFMYCEDVDIQKSISLKGKKSFLIDGPRIVHFEGASSGRHVQRSYRFNSFASVNTWNSMVKFLNKFYSPNKSVNRLSRMVKMIYKLPKNKVAWGQYRK